MDNEFLIKKSVEIIREQILIKKRISVGLNVFEYPISYMTRQCIIQTPIVYIPYSTYKTNNKISFDFNFLNLDVDKDMDELKIFVEDVNNIVLEKIKDEIKKIKTNLKNKKRDNSKNKKKQVTVRECTFKPKEFISNLKINNSCIPSKPDKMRVTCYDNILAFDNNSSPISLDYLKAKSYLKLLLSPVKIWINKEKYGVLWEVLQIKIYPKATLNHYMFIDEDTQITAAKQDFITCHPKYKKYFDMKKKGVPTQAVKNKMLMEGVDPELLDNPTKTIASIKDKDNNSQQLSSQVPPPPPPPPPPLHHNANYNSNKTNVNNHNFKLNISMGDTNTTKLFSELLNKANNKTTLRKTDKKSRINRISKNITYKGDSGYTPSLDEIINKRHGLRKIHSVHQESKA
jgi:hypothetical protein